MIILFGINMQFSSFFFTEYTILRKTIFESLTLTYISMEIFKFESRKLINLINLSSYDESFLINTLKIHIRNEKYILHWKTKNIVIKKLQLMK